jgi:hypothetical protein
MNNRQANERELIVTGILAVIIAICALFFCGCDVNTKVRPWFWPKPTEPTPQQPAPPPKPDPYDWEPWWKRHRKARPDRKALHLFTRPELFAFAKPTDGHAGSDEAVADRRHPQQPTQPNKPPHRPGPLVEIGRVLWGYVQLPLTLTEGVQHTVLFAITATFVYGMSRLALDTWKAFRN